MLGEIRRSVGLSRLPVVILTSSTAESDLREAYALRANSYLVKPFGFARFRALVDTLASYWLEWNHSPTGWQTR